MSKKSANCCFSTPNISPSYYLFIMFIFKLCSGIVLFADIITDALTLGKSYKINLKVEKGKIKIRLFFK